MGCNINKYIFTNHNPPSIHLAYPSNDVFRVLVQFLSLTLIHVVLNHLKRRYSAVYWILRQLLTSILPAQQ